MKVHLKKNYDGSFLPADPEAAEWAVKQKTGDVVYADFKKSRNYQFHKKYFGLLNLAYQNQGQFPSMEALRQAVQIAAGYYDIGYLLDGSAICTAKSISFGKMTAEEFERLYSDVLNVILKHFGFGEDFEIELIRQFG